MTDARPRPVETDDAPSAPPVQSAWGAALNGVLAGAVSIGVATWDLRETPEALERRADQAMYEAKRLGRNRVVVDGRDGRGRVRHAEVRALPAYAARGGGGPRVPDRRGNGRRVFSVCSEVLMLVLSTKRLKRRRVGPMGYLH